MFAIFDELEPQSGVKISSSFGRQNDVYSVCYVDPLSQQIAVANISSVLGYTNDNSEREFSRKKPEAPKPRLFKLDEITKTFRRKKDAEGYASKIILPPFLSGMSDDELRDFYPEEWINNRNDSFKIIKPLINDDFIWRYLRGEGQGDIKSSLFELGLKSQTSVTRRLNIYISLGCSINSLLPFGYQNCGQNYRHNTAKFYVKRGRPTKFSDYRGILLSDKALIRKVAKLSGTATRHGSYNITEMYTDYLVMYGEANRLPPPVRTPDGYEFRYPENKRISEKSFFYHFSKEIGIESKLKSKFGAAFEKDHRIKTGEARDGVIGASHVIEIDSTPLDIHVRIPEITDRRLSAGRPYLCLAICVYTRYIVGFSISFAPPTWANVADCIMNSISDKVSFAAKYNVFIEPSEWYSFHLGYTFRIDNGVEIPDEQTSELLMSPFKLKKVEIVAKGRGDLKSVIERSIGTKVRKLAQYPGGIDHSKGAMEQDASQRALLTIDDLMAIIIEEIILQNRTVDREELLDKQMLLDGVGSSSDAMWKYSLEHKMSGGNPISPKQLPELVYTLLPKKWAKVTKNCLTFSDMPVLKFDHEYAMNEGWYRRAEQKEKLTMKFAYVEGSVDTVYYRTSKGKVVPFSLKPACEQYAGMSWSAVKLLGESRKSSARDLKNQNQAGRVFIRTQAQKMIKANEDKLANIAKNTQTSYQTGTPERQKDMAELERSQRAKEVHRQLESDFIPLDASNPSPEASKTKAKQSKNKRFY